VRFDAGEDLIDKAKKNPDKKPTPEQEAQIREFTGRLARLVRFMSTTLSAHATANM